MTTRSSNVIDVQDVDVADFIKSKWLQMGFAEEESEEVETHAALDDLFYTYSQCYQLPNLVAKLFAALREVVTEGSGGVYFTCGHIPTSLLKTFADCVSRLPTQQTFDLWELFLDEGANFLSHFNSGAFLQGGAIIMSQFFASFLCHMNIIDLMAFRGSRDRIHFLMEKTELFVRADPQIYDLKNEDITNLQVARLLLILAHRKMRYACNISADLSLCDRQVDYCCGFDFLPSHKELRCNIPELSLPYIDCHDKRISYCMVKLIMEMNLTVLHRHNYEELPAEDKSYLKNIMSFLSTHIVSTMLSGDDLVWDMNINSLNTDNYKVAVVFSYVTHLPRFVNFVDAKDLASFCFAAVNIATQQNDSCRAPAQGTSMHHSLVKFLSSEFFTESRALQTAFVTGIWNHARGLLTGRKRSSSGCEFKASKAHLLFTELCCSSNRWAKYADTTPKCGDGDLNSMWLVVKKVSVNLNGILNDSSSMLDDEFRTSDFLRLLQVIDCLPLEYLIPGNQMRCLIGLSVSFLVLANSCSKQRGDTEAVLEALENTFKSLVAIFDGVRSIWLFDHVQAVPYLRAVITVVDKMKSKGESKIFLWSKPLFDYIFNLTSLKVDSLKEIEEFLPELTMLMVESSSAAQAFLCLLHHVVKLLERSYLTPARKGACERLAIQACSRVAKYMKHHRDEQLASEMRCCLVGCYAILLRLVTNPSTAMYESNSKVRWLKWVPSIINISFETITTHTVTTENEVFYNFVSEAIARQSSLPDFIPVDICNTSWNSLKHMFSQKCKAAERTLSSVLKKMGNNVTGSIPAAHNICQQSSRHGINCSQKFKVDAIVTESFVAFTQAEIGTISSIFRYSSDEEFETISNELISEMGTDVPDIETFDVLEFQLKLNICQLLSEVAVGDRKLMAVSLLTQHVLTRIHLLISKTCLSTRCLLAIILPSLHFMSFVLSKKMKKVLIPNPCVFQCLHSCIAVDILSYIEQPKLFIEAYQAVWKVLSLLLSNHENVTLSCRSAFVPCVNNLLKSAVHSANQELVLKWDEETQSKMWLCAHNLEGLFASMSKSEKEFGKIVPYIIADYVDLVQNVTLHPTVKPYLIAGMNRLFDMCSEESIRMLSVNVSHSCREIYNSLIKNYKSGRFVGQV